jgi:hypothetical protein
MDDSQAVVVHQVYSEMVSLEHQDHRMALVALVLVVPVVVTAVLDEIAGCPPVVEESCFQHQPM